MEDTKKNELQDDKKIIFAVSYSPTTEQYYVNKPQGVSIAEVAFGTMVVIKCFVRDGVLKEEKHFMDLVQRYLDDPNSSELTEEGQ